MKYSPKYKVKALKSSLSQKTDDILSLKEQIIHLTDQNLHLKRKLQLSSSNISLISEEFQMKTSLTNEEFQSISQNNSLLKVNIHEFHFF